MTNIQDAAGEQWRDWKKLVEAEQSNTAEAMRQLAARDAEVQLPEQAVADYIGSLEQQLDDALRRADEAVKALRDLVEACEDNHDGHDDTICAVCTYSAIGSNLLRRVKGAADGRPSDQGGTNTLARLDAEIQLPEQAVADYIGSLEQQLADALRREATTQEWLEKFQALAAQKELALADALRRVDEAKQALEVLADSRADIGIQGSMRLAREALARLDAAVPASQPVQP